LDVNFLVIDRTPFWDLGQIYHISIIQEKGSFELIAEITWLNWGWCC